MSEQVNNHQANTTLLYRGTSVSIPPSAEVTRNFKRHGAFGPEVQTALNEIEPWERGEDPIHTFPIEHRLGAVAVRLSQGEQPLWGVNPRHKAHNPGLSPYAVILDREDPRLQTDLVTIELSGTPDKPKLVRAYPGEYLPPLPWMQSAFKADGGLEACEDFWLSHAFPYRGLPDELTTQAPDWYAKHDIY